MTELGGSVLYAEDDEAIGKSYATGLKLAGFDVLHVSDGEEALAALGARHFDVFLLDLHMPGMDGFEVLRRLAEPSGLRANAPVVVILSADDTPAVIEKAFELGAMSALPKSDYTPSRVARRLRRWIDESVTRSA